MAFNQPAALTYTVEDIVKEARKGTLRVPFFQRGFKWNRRDAQRLLDSLLKGYPIGNFLLWKRPAESGTIKLGSLEIDAPQMSDALWVVDGQQRITTLANVLSLDGQKDPRFRFAYDPETATVVPAGRHVPFHVLMDSSQLFGWIRDNPEYEPLFEHLADVNKQLREYRVPVYVVDEEEKVLRDIFHRMNNFGRPMLRSEVFEALHGSSDEASLSIPDIAKRLNAQTGFGLVDDNTILKALFATRGPDVNRRLETEFENETRDFCDDTIGEAAKRTLDALVSATDFLVTDAAVPKFAFLPYRYLLIVLTRFFAHHTETLSPRQRTLLRRWVWRAVTHSSEGFNGYNVVTRKFASCIEAGSTADDSIRELLTSTAATIPDCVPAQVDGRIGKLLLCAMWRKGPLSTEEQDEEGATNPDDAAPGTKRFTEAELSAALDKSSGVAGALTKLRSKWGARFGNRAFFFASDEALDGLFEQPPAMDESEWHEVLRSHALTPEILKLDSEETFCSAREALLRDWLQEFFSLMAEPGADDSPPLASLNLDHAINDAR